MHLFLMSCMFEHNYGELCITLHVKVYRIIHLGTNCVCVSVCVCVREREKGHVYACM